MKTLTPEQISIIESTDSITINAVAGSGKTTTIIEYAASRPPNSRILYLAFNKTVKEEAKRKFEAKGLSNVRVETSHSLAYRNIIPRTGYMVKKQSYKIHEVVRILGLQGDDTKHKEYILANHILKFMSYFCNSDQKKVQDLNYLETVTDETAKNFVSSFYGEIEYGTRQLLAKMDKGEIEITHDFYLKKFQLSHPVLPFDYILFDEGQDASPAMLSVFLDQPAVKVIVGDTHQQIYGWRHAVNSLAKTPFRKLQLSNSFRFSQDIADLASRLLEAKDLLTPHPKVSITGKGVSNKIKIKATIARTNLGLLLAAINFISDNRKVKRIYFEGNINSYTYADEGASLYDVLNLSNGKSHLIRDELIRSMKDIDELDEYIRSTDDVQLGMMMEIVGEYGDEIHDLLSTLKKMQVKDDEREKAEMMFSTVHRAKGMEYDVVYLAGDFLTESRLEQLLREAEKEKKTVDHDRLNEEINLLYVAVTRAKNQVHLPVSLLPKEIKPTPHIHQIEPANKAVKEPEKPSRPINRPRPVKQKSKEKTNWKEKKEKAYTLEEKRAINKEAYRPWSPDLDTTLVRLYDSDYTITDIASHFSRTKGAIISRLKKLGMME